MTATQLQMELVAEHALPILALAENDNKYLPTKGLVFLELISLFNF